MTNVDEGLQINIPLHLKCFTKVSINRKNNTTGKQVYDLLFLEQASDEKQLKYTFIDKLCKYKWFLLKHSLYNYLYLFPLFTSNSKSLSFK